MGRAHAAPVALAAGANTITVEVRPLTRPARSYTIDLARGTDALASIALSRQGAVVTSPLAPAFDPATTSYTVDVGFLLRSVEVAVTPVMAGSGTGSGPASRCRGDTIAVSAPDEASAATGVNGSQGDNSELSEAASNVGAVYLSR